MKTVGIVIGILGGIGLLGWIVGQTLKSDYREDSAILMHPDNFEKPDKEKIIEVDMEPTFFDLEEEETNKKEPLN